MHQHRCPDRFDRRMDIDILHAAVNLQQFYPNFLKKNTQPLNYISRLYFLPTRHDFLFFAALVIINPDKDSTVIL
jgi:hypothetical protein